ncbi:MAG: YdcF family protein [Mucilaginibacter sp.]
MSKIFLYLLLPLTWVFILLAVAAFYKNKIRRKQFFIAAIFFLYLFTNTFLFNQFAKRWDIPAYTASDTAKYSCVIVLGGFAGEDKNGKGHFNWAADRFIQGVKLYKTGKASHILITGGNGSLTAGSFREGAWVKTQLLALGIPDSAVLIESNSRNTIENARFTNVILKKSGLRGPYLLVTSAFHMRRAAMIFKKENIAVIPYSCNLITNQTKYSFDDYFIPSAEPLGQWNLYLKELVGYVVNSFNG